ncbi:integral membrane protein [Colletotrichum tabaci]|uniref:Integral membrane protein n=1 Tax=Colletotrichum tabaci TaxID=1209068 RepID=A0AAV9SUM6_9PEZI
MKSWVARSEEGERLSDIAHNLPPIPVAGLSSVIQVVTYILSVLSTLVIALRIYVRLKLSGTERTWGWDDTFAVAGWIRVKEDMFYFEVIYFASSMLTKLAMAVMILRLSSTRVYSYIIWGNMAVLGTNGFICMVIMFVSCSPLPALWNEKLGYCRMPQGWMLVSYAGSVVLAMVDWTCAVTPFFMLQGLQMPKRRKISLQIILSLGVVGSAAGLVRMGYYHAYDTKAHPHESLYNWGHTVLWSVLEACLGIIACSLPPLRKLFTPFYPSSQGKSGNRSQGIDANGGTELGVLAVQSRGDTVIGRKEQR